MTSSLDRMITSDLAALETDARRDVPEIATALRETGVYRDALPGAQARRDSLAEERRVQLALMPLAIAQVFAHRVGRAAAGAMALVVSIGVVMLLADPLLMQLLTWLVPGVGVSIASCAMVAATAILVTYVCATWVAEAWFTRRMRHAIETHADVYSDLDNLARGPIDVAQQLVRKVDGWSVGLVLAGKAAIVTVFGYLMVITSSFLPVSRMLSTTSLFAERAAAGNLGPVIYALVLGCSIAAILGRGCDREHRFGNQTPTMQRIGHWTTLAFGIVIGTIVLLATTRMMLQLRSHTLPTSQHRYLLAIGAEAALLALSGWGVMWWRRRERARLGD
jgi:hypothetical protein